VCAYEFLSVDDEMREICRVGDYRVKILNLCEYVLLCLCPKEFS
jgi:hypothetical protein